MIWFAIVFGWTMITPASAHEFWLEPSSYTPKTGAKVTITHRNGQYFKGNSYPYIDVWFKSFLSFDGAKGESAKGRKVTGTQGDDPAATLTMTKPGLQIITYYGTPDFLTFENWKKFTTYLESEGQGHILARHNARGLSQTKVREAYSRCAKTLIGVGDSAGADRFTGMPIELVALKNPYKLASGEPLPVLLMLNGKPAPGLTIKVFASADRKNPARIVTDAQGRAIIPLPHKGTYLLNAVHIFDPPPSKKGKYEWESVWASLTFERR